MTVLVTGSSRGIGKAAAAAFNNLGHNIVINCANNGDVLNDTLSELKLENKNVIAIQADVSDYSEVSRMFQQIEEKFNGVDILINNAGISHIGLFSEMSPEQWDRLLDVNIKSIFNCCHHAVGYMLKKKNGVIINISSVWGITGASCEAVYSASKGAVNAFTKALGKELAPSGIRVNAIACGVIDTGMNDFLDDDNKQALIYDIPSSRFGRPDEIADLCVFLASKQASYINGQTIIADGGFI